MTPSSLNDLIDSIRLLLDGRPSSMAAEVVALEYARHCREVNERLGRIAPMLAGGGEIQALQLAEQPPRVLDVAVSLSFGGEAAWQEYCRDHGHEVAPLIDARTLEALMGVESKGVSSNHPLYKDYRTAVSSKDDAKAYELIRIITRLNPSDENAAREIKRLERKSLQAALAELRVALAAKNDDEVLAIMPRVEQSSEREVFEKLAEWQEAAVIRQRRRLEEALRRMPELMQKAEEELKSGNWRHAAVSHGEFSLLFDAHDPTGKATQMTGRSNSMSAQLAKHRAEAERVGRVNQLVAEMSLIADEAENRAVTPLGLTPDFAGPLLENLVRMWRQIEELRGEVPAGPRSRIDSARAQLSQTIERGRSARRSRMIATTAAAILVLLVAAGIGLLAFRASGHAKTLADLQSKQATSALSDLLQRVKEKESILLRFPSLSAAAANAGRWLETTSADLKTAEQELGRLEKTQSEQFAGLASPELHQRMEEAVAMVAKLPADLKATLELRLIVLRNEGERTLQKRQEAADRQAREAITQWTIVLSAVDFKTSASVAGTSIKESEAALTPFVSFASHKESLLRLPASTESGIQDLDSGLGKVRDQVRAVESALAELEGATDTESYRESLKTLASCRFKEAADAQLLLDSWPSDERVKAFLIFRNDLTALKAAENDLSPNFPLPDSATKLDREVIGELMKSETLNGLWEVSWQRTKGPVQNCLSKKELDRHGLHSWSGKVASYPRHSSSELKFVDTRFGEADGITVIVNRISPASGMMHKLQLPLLLDDTGTEYRSSILPLVDRVSNTTDASPLARAYVLSRLFKLIRGREQAWGLHYCPELINDIAAFTEVEIKCPIIENSWLLEEKPHYFKPWADYFSGRNARSISANLQKMKSAASSGIKNPVVLAGHVDSGGILKLRESRTRRLLLGISETKTGRQGPCLAGTMEAGSTTFVPSTQLAPLSPLLCIELPEADQIFLQSIHLPVTSPLPTATSNP